MQSPNLACCPPMSGNVAAHNFEPLENLQNDEAASALTEELTSCNGSQGQLEAAISFMDWRWKEKKTMAVHENLGPADGIADSCSEPSNSTPLFGKTVTPSDVGKLNRLVIPKQHAEKYFPLDVHSSDRGLLLNFEDNTGKSWRFRYSYWNSSQSYVLTKGWSRFVKDKKLEAGDIVSFHRGTTEARQLYIACRRRPCAQNQNRTPRVQRKGALGLAYSSFDSATAYNPQFMHILWPNSRPRDGHMERVVWPPQSSANPLYFSAPTEADLPSAVEAPAENKREQPLSTKEKEVRVFGVNLAGSQRLGELMLFPS